MDNIAAIILCAGKGERAKLPYNKIFYRLNGLTMLEHNLNKFDCDKLIVCSKTDTGRVAQIISAYPGCKIVLGGETRTQSVQLGLGAAQNYEYVMIHDGARPNVTKELINTLYNECLINDNAIPYIDIKDTVMQNCDGNIFAIDRNYLMAIQTPQIFKRDKIVAAYEQIGNFQATDDSQVYAKKWGSCNYIKGQDNNYKMTTQNDLDLWSKPVNNGFRIGHGYDFHKLVEGRNLVLGGVKIPYAKGLAGHSDADVIIHAIMDSLLSAVGERDIGQLFSNTDKTYKDISSLRLLEIVADVMSHSNASINNISITAIAEAPILAPYISEMKTNIAYILGITPTKIGITATTNEKTGAIGRGEGIAAFAVSLITI